MDPSAVIESLTILATAIFGALAAMNRHQTLALTSRFDLQSSDTNHRCDLIARDVVQNSEGIDAFKQSSRAHSGLLTSLEHQTMTLAAKLTEQRIKLEGLLLRG